MTETGNSYGFPLSIASITDVGRVRTNNEDSYGHAWLDDGSLFVIVADGMGGHEAGEVASGLAVRVVEEVMNRDLDEDPRKRLYDALIEANEAILEEGNRSGTRGMGTTAVAALMKGQEVYVALVGDSRLYHIRKGQLLWRTLDHTRVQMLVDQGEISMDEARTHPEAGMLTRALGHDRMADGRPLEPDVLPEPLWVEEGDAVLLSSDGLHDLVEDWEIGEMLAGRTPDEAADLFVETACERGGHDNITVSVVTAGPQAAEYDPDYVPETWQQDAWQEPEAEQWQEPEGQGGDWQQPAQGAQAAPQAGAGGGAVAQGPVASGPTPITADTGVISPDTIAQAQGQGQGQAGGNRKLVIGAVAAAAVVGGLLLLAGVVIAAWVLM